MTFAAYLRWARSGRSYPQPPQQPRSGGWGDPGARVRLAEESVRLRAQFPRRELDAVVFGPQYEMTAPPGWPACLCACGCGGLAGEASCWYCGQPPPHYGAAAPDDD